MVKYPIDTRLRTMYNKRVGDEVAVIPKLHTPTYTARNAATVVLGGVLIGGRNT